MHIYDMKQYDFTVITNKSGQLCSSLNSSLLTIHVLKEHFLFILLKTKVAKMNLKCKLL